MIRPILILSLIACCSALALGLVNSVTKEKILMAKESAKLAAVKQIFPFEVKRIEPVQENGQVYFEVKSSDSKLMGVAVEGSTEIGYGGKITFLVGISPDCKVFTYKVLSHQETPGLGDKITDPGFKEQFKGKSLFSFNWKVKKDGGDIDALTAATISSRAVADGISRGLKLYAKKYEGKCKQ